MVNFTLKNIPTGLHKKLKEKARRHKRSLNSEILVTLKESVENQPVNIDELLTRSKELRKKISGKLTQAKLNEYKSEGRR